jgi:allantoinase
MTLPGKFLEYPHRGHGMDHDLYEWSNLFERRPVQWPDEALVALWVTPTLEYFPITPNDGPFRAPDHMVIPYPDLRTYSTREYGTRVGAYRIFRALDKFQLKASVAINAAVAERYPLLLKEVVQRDWEVLAHGIDMNSLHYGGLNEDIERQYIGDSVKTLRRLSGQAVTGWLSPARSESENTLHLLPEYGIEYCCDWVNDDMPYVMQTRGGELFAMPHTHEIEDRNFIQALGHSENAYTDMLIATFDTLYEEARTSGGRILQLGLTPYVIGLPFRIKALETALEYITRKPGVWSATSTDILSEWRRENN